VSFDCCQVGLRLRGYGATAGAGGVGEKKEIYGARWLKREEKGVKWGIERDGGPTQKK
jgi:hypothetical protein